MSCQSLTARPFAEDKDNMTHCTGFHRAVRFSSESRGSTRNTNEEKKENSGSISLTALAVTPITSSMSQSAPHSSAAFDFNEVSAPPPASCRFPKLEECAHFHYERVCLGTVSVELCNGEDFTDCPEDEGWVCLKVRSHVNSTPEECEVKPLTASWSEAADVGEWNLYRNRDNLLRLDEMLHRCIYDRKVSGLPNLSLELKPDLELPSYRRLISDYMHHLSIIADDSINCGPVLNWLQMDNKGHKLLVANEDSSSINTPAVAAAYSVRKYVSQARDEISFEVGDMISIIDMPGPQESLWWRGKRGFRVGFFPHHCVAVIGDKVPRNMTQPPPIVGSVMVAPIKPVLRKHGKLISLFRSFILSRPSRPSLKQQGILKERVFGCDLGEHLLNSGYDVPLVLVECARAIESRGAVDGVYRLSGGTGLTQRLRAAFDAGATALPDTPDLARDPHAVPSLLKMYFRELPNPLCTYQLYESFVAAMQQPDEATKLKAVRQTVIKLPPPHYRTLAYLMRHLRRISLLGPVTGMTPRNMAIVWAPNLLRAPRHQHALQGVAVQAVVTEFLICYAEELFAQEQGADSEPESIETEQEVQVEYRGAESGGRRPKSLPVNPPTKLLSLEEARRRGGRRLSPAVTLPPPSGAIAAAAAQALRPSTSHKPKYIEVGSGPNNLPQYHTVLDLPVSGSKRGLKRSPSGWRGLFTRTKQHRARSNRTVPEITTPQPIECQDIPMCQMTGLRPVKSYESLTSETDTLAPLAERSSVPLKQHTRSSSCDSYFEPWQTELADMRLRLSPQERDHHMFSEEDDTNAVPQGDSLCSTPPESGLCSVEPSPRRTLHVDIEAANELAEKRRLALEEQVSQLRYIDGESPRARAPPEKRHSARPQSPHHTDIAKRLCKDRDTPLTTTEFQNSTPNVKLRDRSSPRKTKSTRYSGLHENEKIISRLSWHGKDGHSTLIKIDWPIENTSFSNLTTSTLNSTPITPITPIYDPLETDSEISDTKISDGNKHTILINKDCSNCKEGICLKCELKATDYENVDTPELSLDSDISYKNLNRLSAVSTSSSDHKKDDLKNMTSSHDSSSSYTTSNHENNDYEGFNFTRPNYINLNTSSTSSPGSPLKSPLKSTISITFRSPTNSKNTDRQTDRDSIYEDVVLDKNLSIVEEATIPQADACLPTQQACQPDNFEDLIILETPTDNIQIDVPRENNNKAPIDDFQNDIDVYSQVKFFKKSIEEVNALITEKEESKDRHYENMSFDPKNDYEIINVDTLNICDDLEIKEDNAQTDNGNNLKETKNLNVRELAIRFESPTEQKGPFFDKFKTEIKFPSLERKEKVEKVETIPKNYKLSKNSARSLDENAFIKEFGEKDRRKSLEVREITNLPDLNLNIENIGISEPITPTTENKISLIQRFNEKKDMKTLNFDIEKKSPNFETEKKNFETGKKLSSRELIEFDPEKNTNERIGFDPEKKLNERVEFDPEKKRNERIEFDPEKKTNDRIEFDPEKKANERIEFDPEKKRNERIEFDPEKKRNERIEFDPEKKSLNFETEKKLSRERIEKYKEERRNFLREKYSSQSFRSNPDQLTRIKIKKEVKDLSPKFERRNTVDLGQRMRFTLAKSANDLDISPKEENFDRKEKMSPTYNIRDMTALFEHKSNNGTG